MCKVTERYKKSTLCDCPNCLRKGISCKGTSKDKDDCYEIRLLQKLRENKANKFVIATASDAKLITDEGNVLCQGGF